MFKNKWSLRSPAFPYGNRDTHCVALNIFAVFMPLNVIELAPGGNRFVNQAKTQQLLESHNQCRGTNNVFV